MAKKPVEKSNLKKYALQFASFALPLIAENKESIVKNFNNIVNYKRVVKRYLIFSSVLLVALFLLLNGLGLFIDSFFPDLRPGIVQILMGLVLALAVMLYSKLKL
jgi:hypothetical protein